MELDTLTTIKSLEEPLGWMGHLPFAKFLIETLQPGLFVELGTHTGNSYFAFCQSAVECNLNSRFYAVDTWKGDEHSERYDDIVFEKVQAHNQVHYSNLSTLKRMRFDDALDDFDDLTIDLLHIDGFHTYEAVSHDFNTWLPKVKEDGVILFHDICEHRKDFGVWKLWGELKQQYPTMEFHHSHGLGVLFLSEATKTLVINAIDTLVRKENHSSFLFELAAAMIFEKHASQKKTDQITDLSQRFQILVEENHKLIHRVNRALTKIDDKDQELRYHIRLAETYLANNQTLINSASWRVTAPLRLFKEKLKSFKNVLSLIFRMIRNRGFIALSVSTIKTFSQFGLKAGLEKMKQRLFGVVEKADEYHEWLLKYDNFNDARRSAIHRACEALDAKPLISILLPCHNPDVTFLKEAIESVRNQVYAKWELCIADDHSTDPQIRNILEAFSEKDPRIKVIFGDENGHISECGNSALSLVTGEYTAVLNNDDIFHPEALYWVADQINDTPGAALIYTDEDKLDKNGIRQAPHFKPDFNYELFLSQNQVCHLGVYKTDIVRKLGGFRKEFDGAQDWDLALRIFDECGPESVRHIPRVLYHRRILQNSPAGNIAVQPYIRIAQINAVKDHLTRSGFKEDEVSVSKAPEGLKVNFPVPEPRPLISIIIPTKNGMNILQNCIDSILERTLFGNYEILIIDNGSDEPKSLQYLADIQKAHTNIYVHRDNREFNYSALNNTAAQIANGEYLCLLNNDITVITPGWLDEMLSLACRPDVGAVGAKLYYPDDTLQHAGVVLGLGGVAGHILKGLRKTDPGYYNRAFLRQELSSVTAACLLVKKDLFFQVGGFDEKNLAVAFNDVDLCLKIQKAGFRNVWTPYAECYHHESATRGYEDNLEKQARFTKEVNIMLERWKDNLTCDPFFNPNFSLDSENYKLAYPPRVGMMAGQDER